MKGVAIITFALVAVFLFAATGVQARATFVTGTDCGPSPTRGTPAKMWVDDGGILHARDVPYWTTLMGDFPTTASGVEGFNFDTTTGAGDAFGTMTADLSVYGTFSGRFNVTYFPSGVFVGHVAMQGESAVLTADFYSPSTACAGAGGMSVSVTMVIH